MSGFFIGLFTVGLILISLFIVLIVLMQRSSANSGMGSTMGGGAAESAFGTSTDHVLAKGTVYAIVFFFVMVFSLYLLYLNKAEHTEDAALIEALLPEIIIEPTPTDETDNSVIEPEAEVYDTIESDPISIDSITESNT